MSLGNKPAGRAVPPDRRQSPLSKPIRKSLAGINHGRQRKPKRFRVRRDKMLRVLLPKILGLLWERGRAPTGRNFVSVELGRAVEIGCFAMGDGIFDVTVNAFVDSDWAKVFSAYLAGHPVRDARYRYWENRCAIVAWKRGEWETLVIEQTVTPRAMAEVMTAGLAPPRSGDTWP
jgi:hypothetical protein